MTDAERIAELEGSLAKLRHLRRVSAERVLALRLGAVAGTSPVGAPLETTLPAVNRPATAQTRTIGGLHWTIPADKADVGSLSHRLLHHDWLPYDRIQQIRDFTVGGIMLDIGANIGTTSIPRVILGDAAYVYAAEPAPENFACLVANIQDNAVAGYVLPSQVAISSTNGTATLRVTEHIGAHMLTIKAQRKHPTLEVPTVTLDCWAQQQRVDVSGVRFVKIDVQGWEGHVLAGARDLMTCRPIVWQLEISPGRVEKSGVTMADLVTQIGATFGWVHPLQTDLGRELYPASALGEVLLRAHRSGMTFVDVLLGHGTP